MKPLFQRLFCFIFFSLFVVQSFSQGKGGDDGEESSFEYGFHVGRLLPNQVDGATEILPLWGVRAGYLLPDGGPFLEAGFVNGSDQGVDWKALSLSLRTTIKIEDLLGVVYFGADATQYSGVGVSSNTFGGGHIGGGVMAQLGRSTWARVDMKLSASPGTSLYINFGLLFR